MDLKLKYVACSHINREQTKEPFSEDLKNTLAKNFRVLPIFEKLLADHAFSKTHSLQTNKLLQCRWREYKEINISAKPDPFIFPNVNDFHFYNNNTCYKPDQSLSARPNCRFWLKSGPGVDEYGELPLPSDVGFRKTGMMVHKMKMIKPTPKIKTIMRR